MPLNDCRSVYMPYCLKRLESGRYVVLNREYLPLGFHTDEAVNYSDYPIALKIKKLTPKMAKKLSWEGKQDLDSIFFYNGGCVPTAHPQYMNAYLKRLAILAQLQCDRSSL